MNPILLFVLLIIIGLLVALVVRQMTKDKKNNHITAKEIMRKKKFDINDAQKAIEIMDKKKFDINDAQKAIETIQKEYGKDIAKIVEKIMRLETAHFTSGQYKLTGSAGMEAGKWSNIPDGATDGYIEIKDNHDGHIGKFIVWHSVTDFARYLAEYIKRYNVNFARWNTTDPEKQKVYASHVNQISTHFVV